MPELPEVELITCQIRSVIGGSRHFQVTSASVLRQNGKFLPGDELETLRGSTVRSVFRRGKYVVFELDTGLMVSHNAMSGFWDWEDRPWSFDYVEGKRAPSSEHVRVEIRVSPTGPDRGPEAVLRFHDARLFGSLRLHAGKGRNAVRVLRDLGMEALATACSPEWAPRLSHGDLRAVIELNPAVRQTPVKLFLTDQSWLAGVGNIYAAEILWQCKLRPDRPVGSLSSFELGALETSVPRVLDAALKRGVDYSALSVYRKRYCGRCETRVEKTTMAGRSTYFCPGCQR